MTLLADIEKLHAVWDSSEDQEDDGDGTLAWIELALRDSHEESPVLDKLRSIIRAWENDSLRALEAMSQIRDLFIDNRN